MREGEGCQIWPNGKEYRGQWANDRFNGKGILKSSSKLHKFEYQGEFKDDLRHGYGKFNWGNQSIFVGTWKENRAVEGQYTNSKLDIIKGFKAGRMVNEVLDDPVMKEVDISF